MNDCQLPAAQLDNKLVDQRALGVDTLTSSVLAFVIIIPFLAFILPNFDFTPSAHSACSMVTLSWHVDHFVQAHDPQHSARMRMTS